MQLVVPFSHLALLIPGLDPKVDGSILAEQIRQHFSFLGPLEITLTPDSAVLTLAARPEAKTSEADRLCERAAKRAREGDFARAAEIYQRALTLAPTQAHAHRELAMCLMELGRLEEAKDALIDALKLTPDDAWSFAILGNVYSKLSKPDRARPLFVRALELKPSDPWALNGLAASEMALGNAAAGLARFTEATLAHPTFPNAWHGKALAEFRANRPSDADHSLRQLFAHARAADTRANYVFAQARLLFLEVQPTLAERAESESFKTILALRTEVEQLSGFPVEFSSEKLPGGIAALARVAWKHRSDRHRISIRADYPTPAIPHLHGHELTHIQLEAQVRAAGRNRFFSTNPTTKAAALATLAPELRRVSRHLARPEDAPAFADQLIAGVCGLIFNTPIDLLIERRLHRERPVLRPAQILSLHTLAKEAASGTFKPDIRQITPTTILRAAEAMNGLSALCLDDLSGGATDAFAPYAATATAPLSRKLWARWLELEASWAPGNEYDWVDEFAEILGLRPWFAWIPDADANTAADSTAHFPAQDVSQIEEPDLTLEGTSNPELLRKKHPVAVWFLLDALQRHARMTPEQIRILTLEVALLGREGLDYAGAEKKYQLRAIPGETFSGLHLMCLMFAGFKRIAPGDDPQIDLEEPFLAALEEFNRRVGDT